METIQKMKIVAIMVLITLLFQTFSPFISIMNKSYAAVTVPKPAVVWRKNSDVQTTASGTKYFTVQFAMVGNYIPYSFDFKFKYDKTKIAPANKSNPDNDAALITLMMQQDGLDYGFTTQTGTTTTYLNKTEGSLRLIALGGSISPTDLGGMHGYDGYMPIYTFTFKFLDKSATTDDITTDLFELMPVTTVLPTGMKVIYLDGGNKNFTDPSYLKFDNFKEAAKKVKSIAIKNNPTKTTYNHGDTINLAGGNLEVTYTDNTKGTVSMTDPNVTISSGSPANVNNPKVQLSYQGYTAEFPITVNDPVNSIQVTTPPTKTEYNQDEAVNLAGGVVTVTTKSGAKSTINLPNASVTSNVPNADLTAGEVTLTGTTPEGLKKGIQRVTLTHQGKTAKFDIIVNDTVSSISVSNPKTTYQYGQNLDRSQGTINVSTTSGGTVSVPLSNGSATVTGYNPNQLGEQTLTVNYLGKSTTYKVNVTDYVDSIEVKAPTKVEYNYGENLNLAGGTVTDVYKSGTKGTPTNLTNAMISGYNPNVTGKQTVTVTKDGKTATFEVTVNDVVEGIRVSGLKTDYKYGENLNLTGAKVQLTMASGSTAPAVNLTQDMIKTTFNPNKVGEQTLTIEYSGKTTTVNVNVADVLSSISVKDTNKPKDTYNYGETVNKTQGTIVASYVSTATKDIPIQNASVKLQNEDGTTFTTTGVTFPVGSTTATKNMKISYTENGVEKTTLMPVTIVNTMTGISIQGNPKTQYNVNEPFQDNLSILVSREQGVQEAIDVTEDMVKGFSTTTEGTRTATIEYTENGVTKTLTYSYTVTDSVTSIKLLTQPDKTEYEYGDAINLNGATLQVVKGSGTTTIPVTTDMISTYNPNKLGEQQITVSYGGKTAQDKIVVNVIDKVTGISVTPPTKKDYQKGESLDLTGGTVTKIMASGNQGETVTLTQDMITSIFDSNRPGPQDVTVSLDGHTDKFTVRVEDYITGIEIEETPKDTYKYGEALGNPGGKLTVTYKSGTTQEVAITPEMIKELDGSNFDTTKITFPTGQTTATKEVKVVYEGKEANYEITIINTITGIRPQTEPKKDYVVGEDFEENLTILVEREDGAPEAMDVTPDMVEGFDTTTEGKKEVTIKYEENGEEKEYKYEITVTNPITGMELVGTPKTDYIVGQDLDLTGLEVLIHKPGGDERVPVTEDMVTGYNKDQLGEQTVTVTYNGQVVDTYKVNVENPVNRLEWIQKPQTSYVIGESLSVAGGEFKAIKENGDFEVITLTEDMVSAFDTSTKGTKTVIVTYEGKQLPYDITIADRVEKIEITKDPKKDYLYNQDLVAGGEITATKASGEIETVTITPDMITGYHKDQLGNQTVTIHYGGQTVDFELNVSDYVGGVVITPPSKLQYEHGEDLDLSDSKVTVTMASKPNEPQVIPVTPDMITGYDKTTPGSQTVTITYTDDKGTQHTQDFAVNVADAIKSVTLDKTNIKSEYKYGENLDLTNVTLDVTYESGATQKVPVNTGMISGYDPNRLGAHTVIVNYQGFENSFPVNVVDYVKDITLIPPTEDIYKIGDTLSLVGGKIIENMASGATGMTLDLTPSMVSGFDSTTPGIKQIKVTHTVDGVTFEEYFEVLVENGINSIQVIAPDKTDYKYGENLDLTGGKVVLIKEDGTEEEIDLTKEMVSGYDPRQEGQQVVTVTYTDDQDNSFTGSFTVNVGPDYVSSYEFTSPSKKNYKLNEELDLTGGKITEIMASGNKGTSVDITKDMVSGFNSNNPGRQTLTVSYQGKTYYYDIVVGDAVKGISVKSYPDKVEYQKGEALDVTGGILNVVKESGIYEVAFTRDMVSGFNPNKSGIQILKVTYEGFEAQYMVYVVEEKEQAPIVPTTPEPEKPTTPTKPQQPKPTEPVQNEIQEPDTNEDKENENPPLISGTNNDNQNPPKDSGKDFMAGLLTGIAGTIAGLGAIGGLFLLILLFAKDRKNVKIYIEEGNERVLVGKEKVTKNNRTLDLNKYYDRYNEDEYKVVLSKAISKKLDKETVNVIVHEKKESVVVNYNDEAWSYKI